MNRKQIADKIERQLEEISLYKRDAIDLPEGVYRQIAKILRGGKGN